MTWIVDFFVSRPRALVAALLRSIRWRVLNHDGRRRRMLAARREARRILRQTRRRYPWTLGMQATTKNHTDIAVSAPANASVFNAPLGQLDSALADAEGALGDFVISGGLPPTSLTLTVAQPAIRAFIQNTYVQVVAQNLVMTASMDNYVDLDSAGVYRITTVASAALAPAVFVNSIRLYRAGASVSAVVAIVDLRPVPTLGATDITGAVQFPGGINQSTLSNWFAKLASDPANAKLVFLGDSTSLETTGLYPRLRNFHTAPGEGLGGMVGDPAHIIAGGNNGVSCNYWIQFGPGMGTGGLPYSYTQLLTDAPDLVVMSWGLNDVRQGGRSQAQFTADLTTAIRMIRKGLPKTDIVLRMPNSMTTDDVNANGYVVPNASAQAYTDILRQSYLSLVNRWPNVVVWDSQNQVFGTQCKLQSAGAPNFTLMTDQLHPNGGGYVKIVDHLVAQIIGYWPPFSRARALSAMVENPAAPWTVYPRVVEHPDYYTLIAQGDYIAQSAGGLIFGASSWPQGNSIAPGAQGLDFSGQRIADIQAFDIVQMARDTVFRIPATTGFIGDPSGLASWPRCNLITMGVGFPPANTVTAGTVKVWREKSGSDNLLAALSKAGPLAYPFVKIGHISGGGVNPQITAIPSQRTASQWNVIPADLLYVDGYPTNPIALTTVGLVKSGANLWLNGMPDLTAYVGRLCVIVGQHPPEALGDHLNGANGGGVLVAAGTVPAQGSVDVAIAYPGAIFTGANAPVTGVIAQPRGAIIAGVLWHAWVSAADTITVRFVNPTIAGIVVGNVNFDFWLIR